MTAVVVPGLLGGGAVVLVAVAARGMVRRWATRPARRRLHEAHRSVPASAVRLLGPPPARLQRALADAGVAADAALVRAALVGGVSVGSAVALALAGPGAAMMLASAAALTAVVGLRLLRGRADRLLAAHLPLALEAVARSLRSGASLRQAIADASTTAPGVLGGDLGRIAERALHGTPLVVALDEWAATRRSPDVRLAVAALVLGAETGGSHARGLDGVAATLRDGVALQQEVRALSSQARMSALVIALAPVAFTAVVASADPDTLTFLLRTAPGLACLGTGLALDAAAALWMHRLTRTPT